MVSLPVFNQEGKKTGTIEVNDKIFGIEPNQHVVHLVLNQYLASLRAGTASAKTRTEVRGGGKKPWKQKGTGRARAGSSRSPLWRGGGVVFGPKPRDFSFDVPKKVKKLALRSVLSDKSKSEKIKVLDELKIATPKTKEMAKILSKFKVEKGTLIVIAGKDENLQRASANLPDAKLVTRDGLKLFDLLKNEWLILTRDAVKKLEETLL